MGRDSPPPPLPSIDESAAAELVANGQTAVDEFGAAVAQCKTNISSAASELTSAVLQSKEEVARTVHGLRGSIPTAADVTTAVSSMAVDARIVDRPWLFGLFMPAPCFPAERLTIGVFLRRARPVVSFLALGSCLLFGLGVALLCLTPLIAMLLPPALGLYYYVKLRSQPGGPAAPPPEPPPPLDWREDHEQFFATGPGAARRDAAARQVLASVQPYAASAFNEHVAQATGLAVYGCGILAAAHVGGLKALEAHGLRYEQLTTLAGVSAGSVVVAMLAIGCEAAELFDLIRSLPFGELSYPELGSLLRAGSATFQSVATLAAPSMFGGAAKAGEDALGPSNGPGINSGAKLAKMVREAIKAKCGDPDITLGQVHRTYGKRLVIIVSELDSGRERQLNPDKDPSLPLWVAVRMSMGVPGVMEPFRYTDSRGETHVYCDGGMTNDFPMNALPEGPGRLGLMVRPKEWVMYNWGKTEAVRRSGAQTPE